MKFFPLLLATLLTTTALAEVTVYDGMTQPFSIVFDEDGTIYGVEYEEGNRVFRLRDGELEFISGRPGGAGSKQGDIAEGDGGPAAKGRFNGMHELILDDDNNLYIADTFNFRVRVIDLKTNELDTFAGTGGPSGFRNGPRQQAKFASPHTVDISPDGKRMLVPDLNNRRVREIDLETGEVSTIAGTGKRAVPDDGSLAAESPLHSPRAAIYGRDGSIFIASREGNALRHITPDGRIRTVVNRSGKGGYGGDGGPGVDALMRGPKHLCLDPEGNVVISDDNNHCIRLYNIKDGTIHLLAGVPTKKGSKIGNGPLDTQINRPHGARYDAEGNLWVCDSFNHRILKFTNAGE
ncbi:NHL repeat-containing protein [Calycomorphotria hydatis]|uniref:Virginiamycin B lyase n=1 Tax=Calycomorphotria hydatis TaxID=2528027 RepID=A0A517T613_9PLAN|nr:hypothetical protein [Calycomorphotria hydatis]QDT63804.1 Virginiamycin B lyase [Calycomorphotria hydatis]